METVPALSISSHISSWKKSQLSMAEYCRRNNIKATTFYGWQKREKQQQRKTVTPLNSFIEIPVRTTSGKATSSTIQMFFTELRLPSDISPTVARELISFLGNRQ